MASYRTIACCAGSITEGADGILLGYGTSTSCGTASACSSNAPADAMCCRRDVGTPRTWQGFPEVSSRSLAPAVTTCAPHKITTQAFCEQLRAGTVLGLRAEAQGVNGPLTQLACTDNTSCDEYVREATPAAPMLVRYFRSNIAGENYQFYLQQDQK